MGLSPLFAFLLLGSAAGAVLGWLLGQRRARSTHALERHAIETAAQALSAQLSSQLTERTVQLTDRSAQIAELSAVTSTLRQELTEAQTARARAEQQASRLPELRDDLSVVNADRESLRDRLHQTQSELVQATANLDHERRQTTEKIALLTGAREDLTNQFKTLAHDILEEKSKRFTAENQLSIGHLLDPLKTRLTEFQAKVEEVQKEGIAGRTELKAHIGELKGLNERLSSDATNLVNALKGSSKKQGDWGEFILERILEACGLRKGHEYRVQETFKTVDGRRGRPDVIIDLRDGRHLVIDAKVSLVDYNDYCNCDDEVAREASLNRHLASIRTHLRALSERNYQTLYGLKSLDFVVMFVPIEPAFMLAIARDEKMWEDAWGRNVLLVSPSTLLFVIRTVANLWRQETQARQVQAIVERGRLLYDKLASFARDLTDVGVKLEAAQASYHEAIHKLSKGNGNAIRQAELLKKLGVKPTKSLPASLIDNALHDAEFYDELEMSGLEDGGTEDHKLSLTSIAAEGDYLDQPAGELTIGLMDRLDQVDRLKHDERAHPRSGPTATRPQLSIPQISIFEEMIASEPGTRVS
ncbi:MAG TPA: DNA recombination protein RmuC [Acidisarcina sp.]